MAEQILTLHKFKTLARVNEPHCISIFIPTHRAGQEVNEKIDQKNLKNQVKEIRHKLESWQVKDKDIHQLLEPIEALVDDTSFWKYQSDGLAIFRNNDQFEYFTVPVYFEAFNYLSDHYYLKPLIPYLNQDERFYLLALSLHEVKLYEGFAHRIDKLDVHDLLPENLEKAVGYDYKQKYLQFRSGHTGGEKAMFHGHGEGKDDAREEVLKFFRAVNDGVMKVLHDETVPLVLATVDYLFPLYREANEYNYLYDRFIAGNPEHSDPVLLHEKAMELLDGVFDRKKKEKLEKFEKALSDNLASYKVNEIVPAAVNQRVDTLFAKNLDEVWGMLDREHNDVITEEFKTKHNAGLMNLAAVHTILNNGNVYLMDAAEMPGETGHLNALFRY